MEFENTILFFLAAAVLGTGFRFLLILTERFHSDRAQFAMSLADLCLSILTQILVLYFFLTISSTMQAFGVAVAAILVCGAITAARLWLKYCRRKKYKLSDRQKAELMDL